MARLSTAQRREQLLAIGRRMFSNRAFDELSMDDVAKRAGVSKGLLYHYFGDKRGYYQAVLGQVAVEVLDVTTFPTDLDDAGAVRHAVDAFLHYVEANEPFYKALVRGGVGSDAAVQAQLEEVRRSIQDRLIERLQLPSDTDTLRIVYGWIGFVEFTTLDWLERDRTSLGSLAAVLISSLIALLETRP